MTVELVTGHAGTGHIDSFDVGGLIAGVAGSGDYVLEEPYGTLGCTVQDNNHVTVGRGDLLINGRHVRVTSPETLTVTSGTQGQQRHDLIAMHYDRDTNTGVETASLEVLRGTPGSSGTPGYGTDTILNGATARDMPLYRLDLDGISLSTSPARLFDTLKPVSAITSDVSKISTVTAIKSMEWRPPFSSQTITLTRVGSMVTVNGFVDAWYKSLTWHDSPYPCSEKIPMGYRPAVNGTIGVLSAGSGNQMILNVGHDGSVGARGASDELSHSLLTGSWLTADPMPVA